MSNSQQVFSEQFREADTAKIMRLVRAGESISIVGATGVGKSNFCTQLLNVEIQKKHFGSDVASYLFVRVNFHQLPDFSIRSIYSLILEQLEAVYPQFSQLQDVAAKLGQIHNMLLDAGTDVVKVNYYFRLVINTLLAGNITKIVFVFDHFRRVYQEAEPLFFTNLRGLRDMYKFRLSYVLSTQDTLPNLALMDSERSEFYELVATNELGLAPYQREDAELLLERISARYQFELSNDLVSTLLKLTGGHAGLLRAALPKLVNLEVGRKKGVKKLVQMLIQEPSIQFECERTWDNLSREEQHYLYHATKNLHLEDQNQARKRLQLKGFLTSTNKIFSPLFSAYVQDQGFSDRPPIELDEAGRVWVYGEICKFLSQIEYGIFKTLWEHRDKQEAVTKDELILTGWHHKGAKDISDEALTQHISRLRKKLEPDPEHPIFIITVPGVGYRLISNPE
ncbi:MAG: hypothetical protein Fur0022_18800 [Anaerolineales bacterium]